MSSFVGLLDDRLCFATRILTKTRASSNSCMGSEVERLTNSIIEIFVDLDGAHCSLCTIGNISINLYELFVGWR